MDRERREKMIMKELTLSKQYAIVALDGLESLHPSVAKEAVIRAVAAAKVLEEIFDLEEYDQDTFFIKLNEAVEAAKRLKKKEGKEIEQEIAGLLEKEGLLETVPDLLGCDMNYYTAGVELKAYRSEEKIYLRQRESLRAEILEEGEISPESIILLWLHRESGCMHDLFSVEEQNQVQKRILDLAAEKEEYRRLWEAEFHNVLESFIGKFLRVKSNLFKNPYLEGINLIYPFLERRNAIFVDFVVFGTTVKERRVAVLEFLCNMGHYVEEVKSGSETLLKIDNRYYRIMPATRRAYSVPIQGVNIVPVYW